MKKRLLKGFENEYALLETGEILDLQTNKIKRTFTIGSSRSPYVDLYKDGIPVLTNMYVIRLILAEYLGVSHITSYNITYLDGDCSNLSLNNIEVTTRYNTYIPKVSKYKKPSKIYRFTIDGAYVYNQKELDEIRELNRLASNY